MLLQSNSDICRKDLPVSNPFIISNGKSFKIGGLARTFKIRQELPAGAKIIGLYGSNSYRLDKKIINLSIIIIIIEPIIFKRVFPINNPVFHLNLRFDLHSSSQQSFFTGNQISFLSVKVIPRFFKQSTS